jgi:hypothetical protein
VAYSWACHQVGLISVDSLAPTLSLIMTSGFNIICSRQAQELGLHRQKDIYQADQNSIDETLSLIWYEEYKKRI